MIYLAAINILLLLAMIFLVKRLIDSLASKRTLYRLMNHTNIGYYKYRFSDGTLLDANKGFADIIELELKRKELIGRSLSELIINIEDEDSLREKIKRNRYLRNYEYHFKTLKGKDKWMLYNSYIFKDPYSREEMVEAWFEDITEERLSYEKMKESQQRYENLFKNSGDMVIVYGFDDGNMLEMNPQTESVTGYSKEELVGRSFARLFHPLYRGLLKDYQRDLVFGGSTHIESVLVCKKGLYREISMTLSVYEEEEEKIVIAILRDISALVREREEQDLRKKELERLWKASIEREERIKDLRGELRKAMQQLELFKGKSGKGPDPDNVG